eukprot:PLAT8366.1.p1 GENE.PLAT8366.1~~PLAT8366.1.p1  ORF type:complete len:169 (+),score=22.67 PLAT8366.1:31-537(+)
MAKSLAGLRCYSCGSRGPGLLKCGRCHAAYFCGVECQREAWGRHQSECNSSPHAVRERRLAEEAKRSDADWLARAKVAAEDSIESVEHDDWEAGQLRFRRLRKEWRGSGAARRRAARHARGKRLSRLRLDRESIVDALLDERLPIFAENVPLPLMIEAVEEYWESVGL